MLWHDEFAPVPTADWKENTGKLTRLNFRRYWIGFTSLLRDPTRMIWWLGSKVSDIFVAYLLRLEMCMNKLAHNFHSSRKTRYAISVKMIWITSISGLHNVSNINSDTQNNVQAIVTMLNVQKFDCKLNNFDLIDLCSLLNPNRWKRLYTNFWPQIALNTDKNQKNMTNQWNSQLVINRTITLITYKL